MKIVLPIQAVNLDRPTGVDPTWYEKLSQIAAAVNNGTVGQGKLATNATDGFAYLPTCAGAPTGAPIARAGYVPCIFDTTNNKLWVFNGAWKGVVLT